MTELELRIPSTPLEGLQICFLKTEIMTYFLLYVYLYIQGESVVDSI